MRLSCTKIAGGIVSAVALSMPTAALAAGSGVSTAPNQGNASGGHLERIGATTPLAGPRGTGLTRGVTSSKITIGCVYTFSDYAGYDQGIRARFAEANRAGGIFGRKLDLAACKDDGNTVEQNITDVQQLVNQQHVFAMLSLSADILPGSTDFLSKNQVPFFGWGFNPGFCDTRWGFGWNGCEGGNAFPKSQVHHAAIAGKLAEAILAATKMKPAQVRFAVQANSNESGKIGNAEYDALFQALGAKVVYSAATFPTTVAGADVTPYVQSILASKPNVVYLSTTFPDVGPLAAGLRAAGYKGVIMDFTNYIPGLLQASPQLDKSLQGEYVNTEIVPQEENTPYIRHIKADLKAIGQKPFVTLGAEIGYIEADELVGMLQHVGKDLNTKTFDQRINDDHFISFNKAVGGPGKLDWPAAHIFASDCAAIVKVHGVSYKVVEPFRCYQSFQAF